jgi:hypothetical protein
MGYKIIKYSKNKITKNSKLSERLKERYYKGKITREEYDNKINKINEQNSEYLQAMVEIEDLESSSQVYDVKISDDLGKQGNESIVGKLTYDTKTDLIIINLLKSDANLANTAHEFKHAYEFDIGGYALMPNEESAANTDAWDVHEERDANRRAKFFGGSTSSRERGNTIKTYIDERHIRKYSANNLIYRYNGKTYK